MAAADVLAVLWSQVRLLRVLVQVSLASSDTPSARLSWIRARPMCALSILLHFAVIAGPLMVTWPSSPLLFCVATVPTTIFTWNSLPFEVDNGAVFELLAHWCLCISFAAEDVSLGQASIRVLFVIVYGAAAWAKLNWDFLAAKCSCSTVFSLLFLDVVLVRLKQCFGCCFSTRSRDTDVEEDKARWRLKLALRVMHVGVLAVEIAIPIAMVWCPIVGVILDLAFHALVGTFGFDFSAVSIACLPAFFVDIDTVFYDVVASPAARAAACVFSLLCATTTICFRPRRTVRFGALHGWYFVIFIAVAYAVSVVELFGGTTTTTPASLSQLLLWLNDDDNGRGRVAALAATCVVLSAAILNAAAPYLGLKTHTSWAMFSNLSTEGGRTNHIFMPSWQPFGYLQDVAVVLSSTAKDVREFHCVTNVCTDPHLLALSQSDEDVNAELHVNSASGSHGEDAQAVLPYCVPYAQLRSLIARCQQQDFSVTFVRFKKNAAAKTSGLSFPFLPICAEVLIVSDGQVECGDATLRRREVLRERLGFCRSWLPNGKCACSH